MLSVSVGCGACVVCVVCCVCFLSLSVVCVGGVVWVFVCCESCMCCVV